MQTVGAGDQTANLAVKVAVGSVFMASLGKKFHNNLKAYCNSSEKTRLLLLLMALFRALKNVARDGRL